MSPKKQSAPCLEFEFRFSANSYALRIRSENFYKILVPVTCFHSHCFHSHPGSPLLRDGQINPCRVLVDNKVFYQLEVLDFHRLVIRWHNPFNQETPPHQRIDLAVSLTVEEIVGEEGLKCELSFLNAALGLRIFPKDNGFRVLSPQDDWVETDLIKEPVYDTIFVGGYGDTYNLSVQSEGGHWLIRVTPLSLQPSRS